jgi:hypothetical protein
LFGNNRISAALFLGFFCFHCYALQKVFGDSSNQALPGSQKEHRSPILSGALSAIVPGGGQIYNRRYIKAGAFVALEAIFGSVANFWYQTSQFRESNSDEYSLAVAYSTNWNDSMMMREKARMLKFDALSARYSMYNALSWMIGGYIYNIFDAVGASGYFDSDTEKSPVRAAWLSAIPGLGLGQLYNGSVSKAGMIMMVQASLGVKAVNEHRLMNRAQYHFEKALTVKDSAGATPVADEYNQDWESRRSTAFRNRNQYLWYSLFFYVYGILDAVVDAHLHDYQRKMRAYPDLIPEQQAFRINVDYLF